MIPSSDNSSVRKPVQAATRLASIGFALQGIHRFIRQEPNARVHLAATILVVLAGILRHIGPQRWAALIITITLVWIAEALNTAIERLCDLWCDGAWHPQVKIIKDISAGAVLIASMASVAIAVFVFFF